MLSTGHYAAGLIILGGYFLIVSNVDTFLRPRLISKEAEMSFAQLLLSTLGGYELFGFFGVVYGPVMMILFLTALEVYEKFYSPNAVQPTPEIALPTLVESAETRVPANRDHTYQSCPDPQVTYEGVLP